MPSDAKLWSRIFGSQRQSIGWHQYLITDLNHSGVCASRWFTVEKAPAWCGYFA